MVNENTPVFIYGLVDPRDNEIKYVGWTYRSLSKRLRGHLDDALSKKRNRKVTWIKHLASKGLKPSIVPIEETTYDKRCEKEQYWIKYFGRDNLVNSTDGGEGTVGFLLSDETKALLSKQRTGRRLSQRHIEGISRGKLGSKNPNYQGKATTKESIMKIAMKLLGRKRPNHAKKLQGKKRTGSSSFVGVTKRTRPNRIEWEANIVVGGKAKYIGTFKYEEDAARAYDKEALRLYGEDAIINFSNNL